MDSPAANAVFAKQIGIKFLPPSDMNHKMLASYGILKTYERDGEGYQWALRANIIIDKDGIIRHMEGGHRAVDPNTAESVCIDLHKKQAAQ